MRGRNGVGVAGLVLGTGAVLVCGKLGLAANPPAPVPMPLAQARQTVSLLNDAYINAVVLTHKTYVEARTSVPAASVARQLFQAMQAKGWPETRWLSTTGRPLNPDARPKDRFEREAVAALKKGQARFERVEGDRLRVATLVPLVDKSCQSCHTQDRVGDPIGGLSYTVLLNGK